MQFSSIKSYDTQVGFVVYAVSSPWYLTYQDWQ